MKPRKLLVRTTTAASAVVGIMLGLGLATALPASAQITGDYTVWTPRNTAPSIANDPNMSDLDPAGATDQVDDPAAPLSVVTVYENTGCSGFPCGDTYWNPVTNEFRCYGYSSGSMRGVEVNRSGPGKIAPDGQTFGPGDTWLAKTGSFSTTSAPSRPLTVHFPGSDDYRSWGAGSVSSVTVDQATGLIWFTVESGTSGLIGRLDPATNEIRRWVVGRVPRDIHVDASGRAYATVGPTTFAGAPSNIVRVDASNDEVKTWTIPGSGLQGFFNDFAENPDGIAIDADGRIWFAESQSDEIGRLDPSANDADSTADDEICEYKKVDPDDGTNAIDEPQNLATSGAGDLTQVFWAEGFGNAIGVLTQVEAEATTQETCTAVTPAVETVDPVVNTHAFEDHSHTPVVAIVPPFTCTVDGVDGVPGSGDTVTAGGDVIPGILRFPLPPDLSTCTDVASGGPVLAGNPTPVRPTGITPVLSPGTVAGSLIGSEQMFLLSSAVIIAPPPGDPCEADPFPDEDGDGICDFVDACLGSSNPDDAAFIRLGVQRFAQIDPSTPEFETTDPRGGGQGALRSFSIEDTQGCNCEDIKNILIPDPLEGEGHLKFGCSISLMDDFLAFLAEDGDDGIVEAVTAEASAICEEEIALE